MKLAKLQLLSLLCVSMFSHLIYAKNVEYVEDAYFVQAPAKLVAQADHAAQLAGFEGDYQVMVSKKAAMEINPWNKFMAHGINPTNQKPFISINPEWVKGMPADQQEFLLARAFTFFVQGSTPASVKIISYFFIIFGILLGIAIVLLLRKTVLVNKPWWMLIASALFIAIVCELLISDRIEAKLKSYFTMQHDLKINQMVVVKTGNKDAAIKAFEYLDSSIKAEVVAGQTFLAPFENMFESHLQDLKK